jgi:hypothetical protein
MTHTDAGAGTQCKACSSRPAMATPASAAKPGVRPERLAHAALAQHPDAHTCSTCEYMQQVAWPVEPRQNQSRPHLAPAGGAAGAHAPAAVNLPAQGPQALSPHSNALPQPPREHASKDSSPPPASTREHAAPDHMFFLNLSLNQSPMRLGVRPYVNAYTVARQKPPPM